MNLRKAVRQRHTRSALTTQSHGWHTKLGILVKIRANWNKMEQVWMLGIELSEKYEKRDDEEKDDDDETTYIINPDDWR